MDLFEWIAHVVLFFVVLKVMQVVFWNVRKRFYIHPWLIEGIVAVVAVAVCCLIADHWWMTIALGALFGVIRGDQEQSEVAQQRQLL